MTKIGNDVVNNTVSSGLLRKTQRMKRNEWYSLLKTHDLVDRDRITLYKYNWTTTENWEKGNDFFLELWKFYIRQKGTYKLTQDGTLSATDENVYKFNLPRIYVMKEVHKVGKKIMKLAEKDIDFAINLVKEKNLTLKEIEKIVDTSLNIL